MRFAFFLALSTVALSSGCTETPSDFPPCVDPQSPCVTPDAASDAPDAADAVAVDAADAG